MNNNDKPYYVVDDQENKRKIRYNKFLFSFFYTFVIVIIVLVVYLFRIDRYEIYLDSNEILMDTGSTYQIKLTPKNAVYFDISNYEYISEDSNIATVTEGGTITTVGKGTTNVIIKFKNSFYKKKLKVISDDVNVQSLEINTDDSIEVNENKTVIANVNGKENVRANITYESDNQSVIMVDDYGNLNAIKEGQATITVKSDNGVENKKTIRVLPSTEIKFDDIVENNSEPPVVNPEPPVENPNSSSNNVKETTPVEKKNTEIMVTSVKLNITSTTLTVGDSISLKATISPSNASNLAINWSSSNSSVATVVNGKVVAVKAGNAVIKATSANGKTAICDLIVKAKETPKPVTPKPVTPTPSPQPAQPQVDKTPPSGTCKAVIKGGTTTVTVSTTSKIKAYNYNGKELTTNTYTQNGNWTDANVVLIGTNGVSNRIKCSIDYQTLPEWTNKWGSTKYSASSNTLKVDVRLYKVKKSYDVYLSYIWVKNANEQLHKKYGHDKPVNILSSLVKSNGLTNKIVLGFNASPPVGKDGSESFYSGWQSDPKYNHKEPSTLMITNGVELVNDSNKTPPANLYLYYIDKNNNLQFSPNVLRNMTVAQRASYYNTVKASGTRNTFTFRPPLVNNNKDCNGWTGIADSRKQALCQLNTNNFIVVSADKGISYPNFTSFLIQLGCNRAVELDAGGSTATFFKSAGTNSIKTVIGGGRKLTSLMYFTE